MEAVLIVLIGAQFIYTMWRDEQWREERADLLNRLAAGQTIPPAQIETKGKPPPKGGNMVNAGLKRAEKRQLAALKAGDD
jgi:hypothetical protein